MAGKLTGAEETPEQAAGSIAAALDFLEREAQAAGLSELVELLRQASAKARERSEPEAATGLTGHKADLLDACKAIVRLPEEYRKALILKKVYRRSYTEIADECSVSVATAKERVMKGFRLVRMSLRTNLV